MSDENITIDVQAPGKVTPKPRKRTAKKKRDAYPRVDFNNEREKRAAKYIAFGMDPAYTARKLGLSYQQVIYRGRKLGMSVKDWRRGEIGKSEAYVEQLLDAIDKTLHRVDSMIAEFGQKNQRRVRNSQ
jgi:hypothetical protein